jgi:acetyl coenzyme A synthetase (ADP forming)-like protein
VSRLPYAGRTEADVALRDGATVRVRPVRAEDEGALLDLLLSLSDEARELRFLGTPGRPALGEVAREEAGADQHSRFGLVALCGPDQRVVGHAEYVAREGAGAEVAFAVRETFQGRGLGTILLGQLAQAAAAFGIERFFAEVQPCNRRMLGVFRDAGFPVEVRDGDGALHVSFPTALTEDALAHFEERERAAASAAMTAFFAPPSVAVVGASRQRGTLAGEIFHNLLAYGFNGPVYPVNPGAAVVQSVVAYPSVAAIPGEVGLAVLVLPAEALLEAVEQCGRKGVRALVAISAGFAEMGPEGRARQDSLLATCRRYGMRLVGPNCMGIVNTDPEVRLDAIFAPEPPREGRIGFASQSGALGKAMIEYAASLGLGISSFVSMGNKADVSGNDLLHYWEQDPRTDVVLLYLESFGNPRHFSRIARRVGLRKPIVAVKSGRTRAGTRATSSHTGALLAASDVTVDALFRQAGVIRTDTLEELFDVAALLSTQPPPRGRRVAILTNAGGPGILCTDACEAEGLEIPMLSADTQQRLRAFLPPEASVTNPVDMIASASAEHYHRAIEAVAEDPSVDALVVIYIPPLETGADEVARAIAVAAEAIEPHKTILTVFMSRRGAGALGSGNVRVPSYLFPEAAAIALARAARYGEWRRRPTPPPPRLGGVRRAEAAALVARSLDRGAGWLAPDETHALLSCYGLPVTVQRLAATPAEAGAAAAELGLPVALKAVIQGAAHKADVGAVRLRLAGSAAVTAAAQQMLEGLAARRESASGFLVQPMAGEGVEMIVGVVHDPQFGPVVACGAGGTLVELLGDVAVRLAPLTEPDAREMIAELRSHPLLTGYRGQPVRDRAALEDLLLRTSALVDDLPEIAELDINPVIVHESGATIVDARVRIEPAPPPAPIGARR